MDGFGAVGCVIIDECHHVTAETIEAIVGAFPAKFRFGVSATPDRKDDRFEFALDVLGEVFHQDDEDELRDAGVLMRPRVKVVRTNFSTPSGPTTSPMRMTSAWCRGASCQKSARTSTATTTRTSSADLIENQHRNNLVIRPAEARDHDGAAPPPDRVRPDQASGGASGGSGALDSQGGGDARGLRHDGPCEGREARRDQGCDRGSRVRDHLRHCSQGRVGYPCC